MTVRKSNGRNPPTFLPVTLLILHKSASRFAHGHQICWQKYNPHHLCCQICWKSVNIPSDLVAVSKSGGRNTHLPIHFCWHILWQSGNVPAEVTSLFLLVALVTVRKSACWNGLPHFYQHICWQSVNLPADLVAVRKSVGRYTPNLVAVRKAASIYIP